MDLTDRARAPRLTAAARSSRLPGYEATAQPVSRRIPDAHREQGRIRKSGLSSPGRRKVLGVHLVFASLHVDHQELPPVTGLHLAPDLLVVQALAPLDDLVARIRGLWHQRILLQRQPAGWPAHPVPLYAPAKQRYRT